MIYINRFDNFTGLLKDYEGDAYYENGKLHRVNAPAIECNDGHKEWYIHGKLHREDGPAVEWADGKKDWIYNGKYYGKNNDFTAESWIQKCRLEIFI